MPIFWRILCWIDKLNQSKDLDIGLDEFAHVYDLTTFANFYFFLRLKPHKSPTVLKAKHNDNASKEK